MNVRTVVTVLLTAFVLAGVVVLVAKEASRPREEPAAQFW